MTNDRKGSEKSSSAQIDDFLRNAAKARIKAGAFARGRLISAMDATASRQLAWDQARRV
ncbi:MAG TPA: hypothetical protein VKB53_06480 [Gammaproteobacteria bacterium]|nr:hypothetical protein [Gammaproteobacteria bacterium]HKH20517.1 hypothetical protein [Gammaproteobacteria bacterium]